MEDRKAGQGTGFRRSGGRLELSGHDPLARELDLELVVHVFNAGGALHGGSDGAALSLIFDSALQDDSPATHSNIHTGKLSGKRGLGAQTVEDALSEGSVGSGQTLHME